jgi:hypothetical protein
MNDIEPVSSNFWANPNNVTYAGSPVIAPGVIPSPLYKHGSGRALFYEENYGVDFRGVVFPMGNSVYYPEIPVEVTVPSDYTPPGSPGSSQGYCYYVAQRYFFTVSLEAGDPLPTFLGEPEFPPVPRTISERKALLNSEDWTDYNANFAQTEDYNT